MSKEQLKFHQLSLVSSYEPPPDFDPTQLPDDLGVAVDLCEFCHGTGMEIVPGKGARQCQCRRMKSYEKLLNAARIPRRYANCQFDSYQKKNLSQGRAFQLSFDLANQYPKVERGLLFMGSVGVGKTHLATSILRLLIEKGATCLFYEFGSLLKEIQSSYSPISQTSEFRVLEPIFDAEVLVLDELGASKPTDWVRDTMMHIINTRYNDKKLTLFTTNYLDARRRDTEETLEDRIGARLRSRLYEMCQTLHIEGEDFRKTFDKSAASRK
jgi:DNA replication protein DnaC